jgi:transcriptional regulator with XRE-family HTH domain
MSTAGAPIHPLRQWRKDNDITLIEASGLTGVHASALSRIERSEINPRPRTKVAIARALGAPVARLFPPPDRQARRVGRKPGRPATVRVAQ